MNTADVGTLISDTLLAILMSCGPILLVALVIGVTVAFFQAITQIQEMTLTFVPKIVGIFIAVLIFMPMVYNNLADLAIKLFDIIKSGAY